MLLVRITEVDDMSEAQKSLVNPAPGTPASLDHPALVIYVSNHCPLCAYAYIVAAAIRRDFPTVDVCLVNLTETTEAIPEAVFATPTYLLNGRVWSLGNPSPEKINETFWNFSPNMPCKE